jgi:hypothetical protein
MFVVEGASGWDRLDVPGAPALALVAAHEQDRHAAWVEGEQHAHVAAAGAQLLHVRMAGALEGVHHWTTECRAALLQKLDRRGDPVLLVL